MANQLEQYIREAARKRKMDEEIVLRVARAEGGLKDPIRQSDVMKGNLREPSYGPFQMLVGGEGTGFPAGLGNDALARGIDPRDPNQWQQTVDFALDTANRDGWGRWYGAKDAGVGNYDGIVGGTTLNSVPPMVSGYSAPALPPPTDVKSYSVAGVAEPTFGDKIGTALFGDNADKLKGLFGDGATPNAASKGLTLAGGAFKGGGDDALAREHSTPIQSSLPAMEAADGQRMAAAQQLMSTLLMNRKKLGGMMGARA